MSLDLEIVPIHPFEDGVTAGKATGKQSVLDATTESLAHRYLKDTLGAMGREELAAYVTERLDTQPDYGTYPELEDIYPERLDYLRGFTEGADCTLAEAATCDYVRYKLNIDSWYHGLQFDPAQNNCTGVLLVGPDGVLGGKGHDNLPDRPPPKDYCWRPPVPYSGLRALPVTNERLVLRKPRTGYIEDWGVTNECGVGCTAGVSCSTWMDDPIEDVWPITHFPLLRFANNIESLVELYTRYTLYCWDRSSQMWADTSGDAAVIEKSFRRIGVRRIGKDNVLWCTEGHFEDPEMFAFIRSRRLEYLEKADRHLGAGDMQYATDCHVRFTHIGELCHEPWGMGLEHMRRVLTDHAPFPRAVCRHNGPDTDVYDQTVTVGSQLLDVTHNRTYERDWVPWEKFSCEVPETVTQFPERPCGND